MDRWKNVTVSVELPAEFAADYHRLVVDFIADVLAKFDEPHRRWFTHIMIMDAPEEGEDESLSG